MLSYNEITLKKLIVVDGEPYEVIHSHLHRKQQGRPVNQTKLRSLKSGKVVEHNFHQSETVDEADIKKRPLTYLYRNRGDTWFCSKDNPKERFSIAEEVVGTALTFLREKSEVEALMFNGKTIDIKIPIKMDLRVTEAAPAVKGNTVQGAQKQVTLETGAVISAPLFINEGDVVRVNTETGAYTERVSKK